MRVVLIRQCPKENSWSPVGIPTQAKKSGKYYQRTNIIAGYVNNKSIAPMVFNGSCNTEVFNKWVEHFLIKELRGWVICCYG